MEELMQSSNVCFDEKEDKVLITLNSKEFKRLENILKSYYKKLLYNSKRYHTVKHTGKIEKLEARLEKAKSERDKLINMELE